MKSFKQKFEENYLLGYIKYNNHYEVFLMPLGYWILNYSKYDPSYNPKQWDYVFRDNILNVVDEEIEPYLEVIKKDKLSLTDLKSIFENTSVNYIYLYFLIDFDEKIFVSQHDIDIENNLPDEKWKGIYDDPLKFLPNNLKAFW